MAGYDQREKKRKIRLWAAIGVLTAGALALSMWLAGPSPPRKITMATGQKGGAYDSFGLKYQERLGKMGLEVELVNTNGAIDNLNQLLQGKVDVAFTQGGTYPLVKDPEHQLRGLAALYLEPLWVFYRGPKPVQTVSDFKGRSISIGPVGSGTEAVGKILLEKHGIELNPERILNLSSIEAQEKLLNGNLDVALFVSSYDNKIIMKLLEQPELLLMNFRRHEIAHARVFSYLQAVTLAEGLLDLKENIPREQETLLAPAALLACRADLNPRVVEQILKTARAIHSGGDLIDAPNRFPSLEGVDIPIDDTADTYMKSGESFLSRLLPYWGVRLVLQARILILPLLAIWLPFLKILPMIYNYRATSILKRHYAMLRDVESGIVQANNPEELRSRTAELEKLTAAMEALSRKIPANLQREVYQWRLHVSLVRAEALKRLNHETHEKHEKKKD